MFVSFRRGLRGAYLEIVGFSKEVLAQFRSYLSSPHIAPSTIGQVFHVYKVAIKHKTKWSKPFYVL